MIRIIGLGQRLAGDDGVGVEVTRRLGALAQPGELEIVEVHDATGLIGALDGASEVIVVDAVVHDGAPGQVHLLTPEALDSESLAAVSTHGIDVAQAIAMAKTLYPDSVAAHIHIVGVSIARAERYHEGLSPEVAAAVEPAAQKVLAIARHGA